jgi:GMP synthase-like glutamine amidotransferase
VLLPLDDYVVLTVPLAATAYAPLEWISTLLNFVRKVTSEYSEVRIFGICFGHQIVSLALGAECTRNDKGWEIGTHEVELTEIGRNIFGRDVLVCHNFGNDFAPRISPHFCYLLANSRVPSRHRT